MRGGTRGSAALLVSPWFVGSVVVLLVNDHVLKAAWPGLVTGKLSDVAGVVMVAIAATAMLRRPGPACGLVAVAFALLKTVPVAAIAAAPVLGGVTRTDPTDLVALVALVPTWRWAAGRLRAPAADRRPVGALPVRVVVLGLAVLATTATSTDGEQTQLAVVDDRVYVWDGSDSYRSTDGGRTWRRIVGGELSSASDVAGRPREACVDDDCYRIVDDAIVRLGPDGAMTAVPEIDELGPTGRPVGIVTVGAAEGSSLVVWYPSHGALRGTADGAWSWTPISEFERSLAFDWVTAVALVVMFAVPLLMLMSSGAAARAARRRGLRPDGVRGIVVVTGVVLLALSVGMAVLTGSPDVRVLRIAMAVLVALIGVPVIAWSWWWSWWRSRGPRGLDDGDLPAPDPMARRG